VFNEQIFRLKRKSKTITAELLYQNYLVRGLRLVYKVLIGLWLIPLIILLYGFVLTILRQLGGVSLGIFLINLSIYGSVVMLTISLSTWLLVLRKEKGATGPHD